MKHTNAFAFLITLALTGCSASGGAAEIRGLALDTQTLSMGVMTTVTATYDYTDLDGDALETIITIQAPDGSQTSLTTPVVGATGVVNGRVTVQLILQPPETGEFLLSFVLRDAEGNDSGRLTATLTAVP